MGNTVFDKLLQEINSSDINDKDKLCESIEPLKYKQVNIMFVGATGVGKSSTINALFNTETAKVGYSVDPETSSIQKYELDQITLWDTPGFGDDPEKDQKYAAEIANALKLKDENGRLLIDEVVVLIDGSNRDMGTTYTLLNEVLVPNIALSRILVLVNQADVAMKGRHWNSVTQSPDPTLQRFLDQQARSIRKRVYEATGKKILKPISYSAKCGWNMQAVFDFIIDHIPKGRRKAPGYKSPVTIFPGYTFPGYIVSDYTESLRKFFGLK